MKVNIVNESEKSVSSAELKKLIKAICKYFLNRRVRNGRLLAEKKELTVVFLNAAEMKTINKQFRKKNKPTDILSFASDDPESLGELLLCLPVLQKQAVRQKHSLRHETAYMLIHGILHLLGYDHELSEKEERLMFRLQDACFEKLEIN